MVEEPEVDNSVIQGFNHKPPQHSDVNSKSKLNSLGTRMMQKEI